jgi:alpha-glucosidase
MIQAPLDTLPIFVRAGQILFEDPVKPHIDAHSLLPMTIQVYVDPSSGKASGQLYEDDGLTFECQQGKSNRITFDYEEANGKALFRYNYEQRGYLDAAQPWIVRIKYATMKPSKVNRLDRLEKHAWKSMQPGWYVDDATGEIVLHLMPTDGSVSFEWGAQS